MVEVHASQLVPYIESEQPAGLVEAEDTAAGIVEQGEDLEAGQQPEHMQQQEQQQPRRRGRPPKVQEVQHNGQQQ